MCEPGVFNAGSLWLGDKNAGSSLFSPVREDTGFPLNAGLLGGVGIVGVGCAYWFGRSPG